MSTVSTDPQSTRLGRIPFEHPKAKQYPFRARRAVEPPRWKYHYCRWRPNQQGGTCVGHAVTQARVSGPVTSRLDVNMPYEAYDWCILHDYWTDNDSDPSREFGTSVDAGMNYGIHKGWWSRFEWITDINGLVVALQSQMVVNGTIWTDAMWDTDSKGFLHPDGDVIGGHAWATYGYNLDAEYRVAGLGTDSYTTRHGITASAQSWGLGWGKDGKGTFLLTFDDHESLFQADGECAVPITEQR